jgi:phage I-like protein
MLKRFNNTNAFTAIKLSEEGKVPKEVQILRVGSFKHPKYGQFDITSETLSEFKRNFDARVRGIDVAFDYFHKSDEEAAGWPEGLELRENGTELWGINVEWTPTAQQKLADKEIRYFSPDFAFKWEDPESGNVYNNVLFGGGLTNRPFVKEMKAIVADELQGEIYMNELEKAQAALKLSEEKVTKLSEEKVAMEKQMADMPKPDKVQALEQQIAALQAELAKEKQAGEVAMAEKKKLEEAAKLSEKEKEFNVLLSEGKACAAQKDAYISGNVVEFGKLAAKPNMQGNGNVNLHENDDATKAILKLAEEKHKADPKMTRGQAILAAKQELKK